MLRRAERHDLAAMRAWRNHDEVRGVSLTQHVITEDEHLAWWDRTTADPNREVLIYERNGVPSGVVNFFDLEDGQGWWGYFLDNDGLNERGELFPAWISIQREAIKFARNELKLHELHGETLVNNEAAVDFNARQGFVEVERYVREIGDQSVEVIHTSAVLNPRTENENTKEAGKDNG